MPALTPQPFGALVSRMFHELERQGSIFELPAAKFFTGDPAKDLSVSFHGRRVSSPFGPAAGPHTQLAQNIVASWLGGARILELKTVQILDDLTIPRPCIDMQTVGFNVEWSQELRLEESLEEYVKAAMLIRLLERSGRIALAPGFDATLFDMSVGYGLEGIKSAKVGGFLRGMRDATSIIERLRGEIPAEFRALRDVDFDPCISDTLTLSTFHGCPPEEIEAIVDFLLREHGLHCIVKLNPTLLGREEVRRLLELELGYSDLHTPEAAFEHDTRWEQMTGFMERLERTAGELGLGLGVKFSNTLIVDNHRRFFPPEERQMYLSGPPLHVLAMELVRRFRGVFGDRFPISFSAGIERANFPDAVALGLVPVTVCSDLLKPGGYGRAQGYFQELIQRMDLVGARTIDEFILRAYGQAEAALERAGTGEGPATGPGKAVPALEHAGMGEGLQVRWVSAAKLLNTEVYVPATVRDSRYSASRTARVPRKVGSRLVLLDCVTCDKCVHVCPNTAIFTYALPTGELPGGTLRREGDAWRLEPGPGTSIRHPRQFAVFEELCNECGNCDVFCPEEGGPYHLKPMFFGSLETWQAASRRDGFHVAGEPGSERVHARLEGREFQLEVGERTVSFSGPGFAVRFAPGDLPGSVRGEASSEIDLRPLSLMEAVGKVVLAGGRVSWVRAGSEFVR